MDGMCLTVSNGKGSVVNVQSCTGKPNQKFKFEAVLGKPGVYTVTQGPLCVDNDSPPAPPAPPPPPPPPPPPNEPPPDIMGAPGSPRSPDARRRSTQKSPGRSPRAAPRSPAAYSNVWSAARIVAGDMKGNKSIV